MNIEGKAAIVTGSSRGIGKAIALQLAADGADVVVCGRTEQATDDLPGSIGETVEAIRAGGGTALALKVDVTVDADPQMPVGETLKEFGRIDILVNNAGMLGGGGPFLAGDPALLDAFYRTNLRAPYVLAQLVGGKMAEQGGGVIFNISSGLARMPEVDGQGWRRGGPGVVYGTSKAALDRFAAGVAARPNYSSPAAPLTTSMISFVMLACRTLFMCSVSLSIISSALRVAASMAVIRAACSAAADSIIAWYTATSTYLGKSVRKISGAGCS